MKCLECEFDNPYGMKFCGQCGTRLGRVCSECSFSNPPEFSFCGGCGHNLGAVDESLPLEEPALRPYTPKFLTDTILTTLSSIEGERKVVTVMFADVVNYTSHSEKLDPEEIHHIMNGFFRILMDEIHKRMGTINQFMGDGVMALFGAPLAHEDHALRACQAALSIREAMTGFRAELERRRGLVFEVRLGLNSGSVIVGAIGNDLRLDYTAVGDTTNVAFRMQKLARPRSIVVSKHTFKLARDFFEFKRLGQLHMAGKEDPQEAYELISAGDAATRIEASAIRGLTRFVGREGEMAALRDAFARARSGSGQLVAIVGEAGVGKSRILLELRLSLLQRAGIYLEGRCLHYGDSMPYLPLLDILKSYLQIKDVDPASVRKQKLVDKLVALDGQLTRALAPLQDLLSLPVDDEAYRQLEPQRRREKTFEALRDLFVRLSQEGPLVLAVEDLHWIDKTSQEFLDYLIGWLAGARILLVLHYRPEFSHAWGSRSFYTRIGVDHLPDGSAAELVQATLGEAEVAPELRELILRRSGGNPLFVEELTRSLLENGSIEMTDRRYGLSESSAQSPVPDTIEGIIAARVDRLDDDLKHTLQVAAVVGRSFSLGVLQAVTGAREQIKAHLERLQELEFIYETRIFPELQYAFKHALTQEVAYNGLLATRRKEIHGRIGEAIETIHTEPVEESYEVLAYHYSKSNATERASHYLRFSGDKSHAKYSPWEAFRYYREALRALDQLPEAEETDRTRIQVSLSLYRPALMLGFPEDSLQVFLDGEALCKKMGDQRGLAYLHSALSLYYQYQEGDFSSSIAYAEMALEEAEGIRDLEVIAPAAIFLTLPYFYTGHLVKITEIAPVILEQLEDAGRERDFFGRLLATYPGLCAVYGCSVGMLGDFERGSDFCERGLRIARQIDDPRTLAFVEAFYGRLYIARGEGELAVQTYRTCIQHCEESEYLLNLGGAWAHLGIARYLCGDLTTAEVYIDKGISMQTEIGTQFALPYSFCYKAMIRSDLGEHEQARGLAEKARTLAREIGERHYEAASAIALGRILGRTDPPAREAAEELIRQGLRVLEELHVKPFCADGYLALGELHAAAGRREDALQNLKKAEDLFAEMGMEHHLAKVRQAREAL